MIYTIDHVVLTTVDIDKCVEFYVKVLGMTLKTFGEGRNALMFGEHKINLHVAGSEFKPHASQPIPGSQDWCFICTTPVEDWVETFIEAGVKVIEGPVERTGALGPITSVYVNDPDGNLIEIGNYSSEVKLLY